MFVAAGAWARTTAVLFARYAFRGHANCQTLKAKYLTATPGPLAMPRDPIMTLNVKRLRKGAIDFPGAAQSILTFCESVSLGLFATPDELLSGPGAGEDPQGCA